MNTFDPQKIVFDSFSAGYRQEVMDIFNYYIEHSFAAYPESILPDGFFSILSEAVRDYPAYVMKYGDEVIGFCFLRPYHVLSTFRECAEITYFIKKEHTGKGIGEVALEKLEDEGRKKGILILLASISSKNEGSINFHLKHGFRKCGHFEGIGKKSGEYFDVVWMQKRIAGE